MLPTILESSDLEFTNDITQYIKFIEEDFINNTNDNTTIKTIILTNITSDDIAYKVKTNIHKMCTVSPCNYILKPHETIKITITIYNSLYDYIKLQNNDVKCKYLFLFTKNKTIINNIKSSWMILKKNELYGKKLYLTKLTNEAKLTNDAKLTSEISTDTDDLSSSYSSNSSNSTNTNPDNEKSGMKNLLKSLKKMEKQQDKQKSTSNKDIQCNIVEQNNLYYLLFVLIFFIGIMFGIKLVI